MVEDPAPARARETGRATARGSPTSTSSRPSANRLPGTRVRSSSPPRAHPAADRATPPPSARAPPWASSTSSSRVTSARRSLRGDQPRVVRRAAVDGARARRRSGSSRSSSASASGASAPSITVTISASSASAATVATRVDPAPPQATSSSLGEADRVAAAKAALGIVARGRRHRARRGSTASSASIRSALVAASSAGSNSTRAASAACCELGRRRPDHAPGLAGQPRRLLGGHEHVREFGSTTTSSAVARLDRREQVLGRRVERRAAVDDQGAERLRTGSACPSPLATATTPERPPPSRARWPATCSCMSAMSHVADLAGVGEQRPRRPRGRRCGRGP